MADLVPPVRTEPDPVERLLRESPIGLTQAANLCGTFRDGKVTHPATLTRWATKGVRLPDGRVLRLETMRLNGRLLTSRPALVRFIRAQQYETNAPDGGTATEGRDEKAAPADTLSIRARRAKAASAELDTLLNGRG